MHYCFRSLISRVGKVCTRKLNNDTSEPEPKTYLFGHFDLLVSLRNKLKGSYSLAGVIGQVIKEELDYYFPMEERKNIVRVPGIP